MEKYCLVAFAPNFKDEVIIKIPNINLESLHNIDNFTSGFKKEELLEYLKEYQSLKNQNSFSIKKIVDDQTYYFPAIFNNKEIKYFSSHLVDNKNVTKDTNFSEFFNEILLILEKREISKIAEVFSNKTYLYHNVKNYLDCDPFEEEEKSRLLDRVKSDFNKYENLRKWYVKKKKSIQIKKEEVKKIKEKIKTIEENEELYVANYNHLHKEIENAYIVNKLRSINTVYLDEDQEEFLEEQELEQMGHKL